MISWFKPKPIITFASMYSAPQVCELTSIKPASQVRPAWITAQRDYENSRDKFINCPGMSDWLNAGYIIPAWTDISIKANGAGVFISISNAYTEGKRKATEPMNPALIRGAIELEGNIKPNANKIAMPWSIFTKPGYSAHLLPALYHSPILRDIWIWPGTVDYDHFHTSAVIFSARRECELNIRAGTPLLQVIPFRRENITAAAGRATQHQEDLTNFSFPTRCRAAYRKFFHQRKSYKLENIE